MSLCANKIMNIVCLRFYVENDSRYEQLKAPLSCMIDL